MESIPEGAARVPLDADEDDLLIREEPLWIECHGARLLTMRTPGHDRDLVVGHLLDEGVIQHATDVADTAEIPGEASALRPDTIRITLKRPGDARIEGRLTRTHEIRPSCGICGLVDADALLDDMLPLLPGTPRLTSLDIEDRRRRFDAEQPLFHATGASHSAIVFGPDGSIWGRGEDVGRHNAVDKAVGSAALAGHPLEHGTAMLSGRSGLDLVLKCLRVRIPILLSVSAPSAVSVEVCRSAGATLVGFVRQGRHKVYCGGDRLG